MKASNATLRGVMLPLLLLPMMVQAYLPVMPVKPPVDCGLAGVFDPNQGCCSTIGCKDGCPENYECKLQPPTPCAAPPVPTPPCYCPRRYACEPVEPPPPDCGLAGVFDPNQGCCTTIGCINGCPVGYTCKMQLPTPCAAPPVPEPPCYCPTRYACEPPKDDNPCGVGGVFDKNQGCCTTVGCKGGCPIGQQCYTLPPTPCAAPPYPQPPCYCPTRKACGGPKDYWFRVLRSAPAPRKPDTIGAGATVE